MGNSLPSISALFALPQVNDEGAAAFAVGLLTDAGKTYWGAGVLGARPSLFADPETAELTAAQVETAVNTLIAPRLHGRSLANFLPLGRELDGLRETITVTRLLPPAPQRAVSRRRLLRGDISTEGHPSLREEKVTLHRACHPALQWAVTAALLRAVADAHRQTIAERLMTELPPPTAPEMVPLHIDISRAAAPAASPLLLNAAGSFGYTTAQGDIKSTLGKNAELMQRHLRQVQGWLQQVRPDNLPSIQVDVHGGIERLFPGQIGKVLGALYGWEHVTKPYQLRVRNAAGMESLQEQIAWMSELKTYLRGRRMSLQLVAEDGLNDRHTVEAHLKSGAADMLVLDAGRIGGIHLLLEILQKCREKEMPVLLRGYGLEPLLAPIALAAQPALVEGDAAPLYNGMRREREMLSRRRVV